MSKTINLTLVTMDKAVCKSSGKTVLPDSKVKLYNHGHYNAVQHGTVGVFTF